MRLSINTEETKPMEAAWQNEKKTFRELTLSQKISYIWDYYKWWIIGAVFIIVVLVNAIPSIIENRKEVVLYSVFVNSQILDQASTTLMDDFIQYSSIDMDNKRITLDTTMKINRDLGDKNSMESNQKMLALFSSNTLDVIVCDKDNFDFYVSQDCFMRLDDMLSDELYQKYQKYFIEGSSDDPNVYGITLKDSKILKNEEAFIVESIFAIWVNAKQPENSIKFLEYLLSDLEQDE